MRFDKEDILDFLYNLWDEITYRATKKNLIIGISTVILLSSGITLAVILNKSEETTQEENIQNEQEVEEIQIETISFNTSKGDSIENITLTEIQSEIKEKYDYDSREVAEEEIVFSENLSDVFLSKKAKRMSIIIDNDADIPALEKMVSNFAGEEIKFNIKAGEVVEYLLK